MRRLTPPIITALARRLLVPGLLFAAGWVAAEPPARVSLAEAPVDEAATEVASLPVNSRIRFHSTGVIANGVHQVAGFLLQVPAHDDGDVFEIHYGDGSVNRWDGKPYQVHTYQLPAGSHRRVTAYVVHAERDGKDLLPRARSAAVALNLVAPPPRLALTVEPETPVAGSLAVFRAALIGVGPDDGPREYEFTPGDGSPAIHSARPEFKYLYPDGGVFTARVRLVGTDAADQRTVQVDAPPQLGLVVDPMPAIAGRTTFLRARYRGPNPQVAYRFTVEGERARVTDDSTVEWVFTTPGRKRVFAEVGPAVRDRADVLGLGRVLASSATIDLSIVPAPQLLLDPADQVTRRGDTVRLRVSWSDGSPVGPVAFDPGDGSGVRHQLAAEITHTYADTGEFAASVASDGAIARVYVTVRRAPMVQELAEKWSGLTWIWQILVGGLSLAALGALGWRLYREFFPPPRVRFVIHRDAKPVFGPAGRKVAIRGSFRAHARRMQGPVRLHAGAADVIRSEERRHA